MQKTILLCVELSDILKFAKKHIRRAEDISLFPLPPHLSPALYFQVDRVFCSKLLNLVLSFYTNQCGSNNLVI